MGQPEGIDAQWTNKGFNQRFDEVIQANPDLTYTHAYDQVEREHIAKFGKCRYKDYDSFRGCRKVLIFGRQ